MTPETVEEPARTATALRGAMLERDWALKGESPRGYLPRVLWNSDLNHSLVYSTPGCAGQGRAQTHEACEEGGEGGWWVRVLAETVVEPAWSMGWLGWVYHPAWDGFALMDFLEGLPLGAKLQSGLGLFGASLKGIISHAHDIRVFDVVGELRRNFRVIFCYCPTWFAIRLHSGNC
jgi:hypothetical protein